MQLDLYLVFNGHCRQAFEFYQICLGGELSFQTIGESPQSEALPDQVKSNILTGCLRCGDFTHYGTDICGEDGLKNGNHMGVMLSCTGFKEAKMIFNKLAHEGQVIQPLMKNHFSILMGCIMDKFGHMWILQARNF